MGDILYMVIPAYNESENIGQLVKDWYPVIEKHDGGGKSRLVIINDGSKDNTEELLKKEAADHPLLLCETKKNGGHGDTVLYGYRYAISHGADYIFQTDSDGQTIPSEFETFWENREKYDGQFGNRSSRKDGSSRIFVEKTLCTVLKLIFGVKVPDANAPFRLMKASKAAEYIPLMPEHYNLPNAVMTVCFVYYKDRVCFREVTFRPRQGGTNSINIRKIFKIGVKAVGDFVSIRKNMKAHGRV